MVTWSQCALSLPLPPPSWSAHTHTHNDTILHWHLFFPFCTITISLSSEKKDELQQERDMYKIWNEGRMVEKKKNHFFFTWRNIRTKFIHHCTNPHLVLCDWINVWVNATSVDQGWAMADLPARPYCTVFVRKSAGSTDVCVYLSKYSLWSRTTVADVNKTKRSSVIVCYVCSASV